MYQWGFDGSDRLRCNFLALLVLHLMPLWNPKGKVRVFFFSILEGERRGYLMGKYGLDGCTQGIFRIYQQLTKISP